MNGVTNEMRLTRKFRICNSNGFKIILCIFNEFDLGRQIDFPVRLCVSSPMDKLNMFVLKILFLIYLGNQILSVHMLYNIMYSERFCWAPYST